MRKYLRPAILIAPPALVLAVFFVIPLVDMSIFSLRAGTFGAQRDVFTLDHYRQYLATTAYHGLLWRSFLISLETSLISIVLSYPVAYFLAFRAGPRRLIMLTVLLIPAWTSYLLAHPCLEDHAQLRRAAQPGPERAGHRP